MMIPGLQSHLILGVGLQGKEDVAAQLLVDGLGDGEGLEHGVDTRTGDSGTMEVDVRQDNVVPPAPGVIPTLTGILTHNKHQKLRLTASVWIILCTEESCVCKTFLRDL